MAVIAIKDYETYPSKYRPKVSKEELIQNYKNFNCITYGAFDINNMLCAFFEVIDRKSYFELYHCKSMPEKQKGQLNAALIYTIITDLSDEIKDGKYLSNGQRNLNHQTNFNNDLCKYYGFRRAYCNLHIAINPKYKMVLYILRPFRKLLIKFDKYRYIHQINVVLKMDMLSKE